MKSYVEVLTTPTADTQGTCLVLEFGSKRYIIGNVHEGLQRACIQRGWKLNKVSDLFLTGKTEWKNTGGLVGLILTAADSRAAAHQSMGEVMKLKRETKTKRLQEAVADARNEKVRVRAQKELAEWRSQGEKQRKEEAAQAASRIPLNVHGGPNIMYTIATGRRFIFRKGMPLKVDEIRQGADSKAGEPTWTDENIRVWALPIVPENHTSEPRSPPQSPRKRSFVHFLDDASRPAQAATSSGDVTADDLDFVGDEEARKHTVLKSVISDMFDSDWRMDALVETPLNKVKMPATLFVRDKQNKKISLWEGPKPGEGKVLPEIDVLVRKPWPGALVTSLPEATPSSVSMSYIIKNHPQRGKFQADQAAMLGIPPRMNKLLTMGETVKLEDGTVVEPHQVLSKGKAGGGFAVVDLPTKDYVSTMINRPEWESLEIMEGVGVMFWILGPGVAEDERLRDFIRKHNDWQHMVSSPDYSGNYLTYESVAKTQLKLSCIDKERYPVLEFDNAPKCPESQLGGAHAARPGHRIHLEPEVRVETSSAVPRLNTAQVLDDFPRNVAALTAATWDELRQSQFHQELEKQYLPGADVEIIPLGTGSAVPSKYRNVSSTLIRVPKVGSYLLDCGENTLGQLSRVFNAEQLKRMFRDLKMIWISHMHADHHLGTTAVIKAWHEQQLMDEKARVRARGGTPPLFPNGLFVDPAIQHLNSGRKLFVVSDESMLTWLQEYSAVEDFGYDKLMLLSGRSAKPGEPDSTQLYWRGIRVGLNLDQSANIAVNAALRKATGLKDLQVASVTHCAGAKAVALTFPDGFKISYSGDCRPSKGFVEIGQGSTVLLHEATFDDELRGDARAKKHSTTSEAIGVGMAMGARRILLTHFSQRYQKVPVMSGVGARSMQLEETTEPEADAELPLLEETADAEPPEPKTASPRSVADMIEDGADTDALLEDGDTSKTASATIRKVDPAFDKMMKEVKIGVAFDYMRVKVKDIALLEKFNPVLSKLFEQLPAVEQAEKGPAERSKSPVEAQQEGKVETKKEKEKKKHGRQKSTEGVRGGVTPVPKMEYATNESLTDIMDGAAPGEEKMDIDKGLPAETAEVADEKPSL